MNSKVGQPVDESIWVLELMKEYQGLTYKYFTEEIDANIYDIMKGKLIAEQKKAEKDSKKK